MSNDSDRFAAFSFVDKILSVEAGKSIEAEYYIPDELSEFPRALCCEAVGQCASWAAMAAVDFQYQPVAGITRRIDFLAPAEGKTLVLSAQLKRADTEAVAYSGIGQIDGKDVVQLTGCIGPMLAMKDFDDPQRMKSRFRTLCTGGAQPGQFRGAIPKCQVDDVEWEGEVLKADYTVPESGAFFADHFPRNPVFPGTLLMSLCIHIARRFVSPNAKPIGIIGAKIREFMPPGSRLEFTAEKAPANDKGDQFVMISLKAGDQFKKLVRVGFSAAD